jgi:hypothetical protein
LPRKVRNKKNAPTPYSFQKPSNVVLKTLKFWFQDHSTTQLFFNSSSQPTQLVHTICLFSWQAKHPSKDFSYILPKTLNYWVLETLKILFQKSPNTHSNSFKGGGGEGAGGGGAAQSAIEMAEDVEKRFERAMDCLFPGSSSRGAAAAAIRCCLSILLFFRV